MTRIGDSHMTFHNSGPSSLTGRLKLIQPVASIIYVTHRRLQFTLQSSRFIQKECQFVHYKVSNKPFHSFFASFFSVLLPWNPPTIMSFLSEGEFESFEIPEFPKKKQQQLNEKIADVVWPNELEKEYGWTLGAPSWAVKPLLEEWQTTFDWEESRAEMAQWHHYRMKIDGLLIHYVHERSSNPNAVPIVLLHGWPSTFYEFHKLINPLRDGLRGNQVRSIMNDKHDTAVDEHGYYYY